MMGLSGEEAQKNLLYLDSVFLPPKLMPIKTGFSLSTMVLYSYIIFAYDTRHFTLMDL